MLHHVLAVWPFSLLSSIPVNRHTTVSFSVHQLIFIWVVSSVKIFLNEDAMNTHMQIWINMFSFLLGQCLKVELLSCMVSIYFTLKEAAKLFFKVVAPF